MAGVGLALLFWPFRQFYLSIKMETLIVEEVCLPREDLAPNNSQDAKLLCILRYALNHFIKLLRKLLESNNP